MSVSTQLPTQSPFVSHRLVNLRVACDPVICRENLQPSLVTILSFSCLWRSCLCVILSFRLYHFLHIFCHSHLMRPSYCLALPNIDKDKGSTNQPHVPFFFFHLSLFLCCFLSFSLPFFALCLSLSLMSVSLLFLALCVYPLCLDLFSSLCRRQLLPSLMPLHRNTLTPSPLPRFFIRYLRRCSSSPRI